MLSWQARVLRWALKRWFKPQFVNAPLMQQRQLLAQNGRWLTQRGANITPMLLGGVPAEAVRAPRVGEGRVVMYFHGGGYTAGDLPMCRGLATQLARAAQAKVVTIGYRLAPEHPFPAAVEDARAAYYALRQTISPRHIVLAGDSAGGGLALALLITLRDAGEPLPAAAVCLSPWTDLELSGEAYAIKAAVDPCVSATVLRQMGACYAGHYSLRTPLISPLYADLRQLPPLLIQVGSDEIMLSDSTHFAQAAREAGVNVTLEVWANLFHVWQYHYGLLPEARQAIKKIGAFVQDHAPL